MEPNSPRDHGLTVPTITRREALAFLRRRLYDREPYRVWSNFEFTTANGLLYAIDALAITDNGVRPTSHRPLGVFSPAREPDRRRARTCRHSIRAGTATAVTSRSASLWRAFDRADEPRAEPR